MLSSFFWKIFAYRLLSKKILVMSYRASNILSCAYLSKKFYRGKLLKNAKKCSSFKTMFFVKSPLSPPNIRSTIFQLEKCFRQIELDEIHRLVFNSIILIDRKIHLILEISRIIYKINCIFKLIL